MVKYLILRLVEEYLLTGEISLIMWFSLLTTNWLIIFYINWKKKKRFRKSLMLLSAGSLILCISGFFDGGVIFYKESQIYGTILYGYLFYLQIILAGLQDGIFKRLRLFAHDFVHFDYSLSKNHRSLHKEKA